MSIIGQKTSSLEEKKALKEPWGGFFQRWFPKEKILEWAKESGKPFRNRLWNPVFTLWACLEQKVRLFSTRNMEDIQVFTDPSRAKGKPDGADFCRARARLPLSLFKKALAWMASEIRPKTETLWHGLRLARIDGTTFVVSRTKANLEYFGRGRNQHGESKLCLARAVFFSSGGIITALGLGPYKTSELTLTIQILQQMPEQCLLLGDALFSNYLNLFLVQARGSHVIFGKHASRKGIHLKSLGYQDDLYQWIRPSLSQTCFPELLCLAPMHLEVRVITRTISRRGWRSYSLTVFTTLLDPKKYLADAIVETYLKRWQIETDIRHLKGEHGMGRLECKSPSMIEREFYSLVMAFNCTRILAAESGIPAEEVSHSRTLRLLGRACDQFPWVPPEFQETWYKNLLEAIRRIGLPRRPRIPQPRALINPRGKFPILLDSRGDWRRKHLVG